MNVYEQAARDEMDFAQNIIFGVLAVTLIVMGILIGYEYLLNPQNPGHTPVLIMYVTLCSSANFIYQYFIRKTKVAWIPSAVIGLIFWIMTYVAIFTQGNGHRKNHLPLSPACPKQVFLSSCGTSWKRSEAPLRG